MTSRRKILASVGVLAGTLTGGSIINGLPDSTNQIWSTDLGEYQDTIGLHPAGTERIYALLLRNSTESHVIAVNGDDGTTQWTQTTRDAYSLAADADGVYVSADALSRRGVRIDAFAPGGEHQWTAQLSDGTRVALDSETVYAGGPGRLFALHRDTGKTRWQTATPGEGIPFTVANKTLYVKETGLTARSTRDGSIQWQFTSDSELIHEPIVTSSTVYTSGPHGIYALDTATGALKWQTPVQLGSIMDIAGLSNGSLYVAVSTKPNGPNVPEFAAVYRLHAGDGSLQEVFQIDEHRVTDLAMTDSRLVIVTRDSMIIIVDPDTLTERWRTSAADGEFITVATEGDSIYTLDPDAPLCAFRT